MRVWKSPAHHPPVQEKGHGLAGAGAACCCQSTVPRPSAHPCKCRQAGSSSLVLGALLLLSLSHGPRQSPVRSGGAFVSLSILEDLFMLHLCHQMVTARGPSCAEPRCDAEARDAAESSSLPGAGDGFPHFLPFANTFTYKRPKNLCPVHAVKQKTIPREQQQQRCEPVPFPSRGVRVQSRKVRFRADINKSGTKAQREGRPLWRRAGPGAAVQGSSPGSRGCPSQCPSSLASRAPSAQSGLAPGCWAMRGEESRGGGERPPGMPQRCVG